MGVNVSGQKVKTFIAKYRYPFLILLIGLILMILPTQKEQKTEVEEEKVIIEQETMEDRLERILSTIKGAGEVRVLLSVAEGERVIYQTDADSSISEDSSTNRSTTITVVDSDKMENGLISQVNPPQYQGAIVTCQGADNASVRLAIVDAVSKVTGLGADRIAVLKMK